MSLNVSDYDFESRSKYLSVLPSLPEQDASSVMSDDVSVTSQDVENAEYQRDGYHYKDYRSTHSHVDTKNFKSARGETQKNFTGPNHSYLNSSNHEKTKPVSHGVVAAKKSNVNSTNTSTTKPRPQSAARASWFNSSTPTTSAPDSRNAMKFKELRGRPLSANLENSYYMNESRERSMTNPGQNSDGYDVSPESPNIERDPENYKRLPSVDSGLDDVTIGDEGMSRSSRHGSFSAIDNMDAFRARDVAGSCRIRSSAQPFRARDVTGSLRVRDPTSTLQPITDTYLLQKLQGSNRGSIKLSTKDQRMLSRLLAKREEEQKMSEQRELSHKEWERERELTKLKKQETERQRNKSQSSISRDSAYRSPGANFSDTASIMTMDDDTISVTAQPDWDDGPWQLDEEGQARSVEPLSESEQRRMTICCATTKAEQQKQQFFDKLSKPRSSAKFGKEKTPATEKSFDNTSQKSMKQLQIALDKKKSMEQSLEQQRQKTEKYMARIAQNEQEEREANRNLHNGPDSKLSFTQKLRLRGLNGKPSTRESLSSDGRAPSPTGSEASLYIRRKAEKQRQAQVDLQKKLEKSRQKQMEMEMELKDWQHQVILYRKMQDRQAEALASAQLAQKRAAAAKDREEKERIQRKNKLRMQAQEDEWKATVRASIISKDARSRMLQLEKDTAIRKSRELADITRRMREELKLNASINDLDQLSKHVALENRMRVQRPP